MAALYKCPNIGNCDKADQGKIITIPTGAPTECPDCNATLIPARANPTSSNNTAAIVMGLVFVVLVASGVAAWFFTQEKTPPLAPVVTLPSITPNPETSPIPAVTLPPANPPPSPAPVATVAPPPTIQQTPLLRIHGSNSIGEKLLPALASAFFQQKGCTNVQQKDGANPEESLITADCHGKIEQLEIQSHGSSTAFNDLKDGLADIGMSSRKIKAEEQQLLSGLGDLTSNSAEHVIALDGIAIIVHPSNPVKKLSVQQVADIFSGTVKDWSEVGGSPGAIKVYARDDQSGTYDLFNETVLKTHNKTLTSTAQRVTDNQKLSESVTGDANAIGFVGMNYVAANKVIALSDVGVEARKPSLLTVKTEDYRLSRRLYLYTAEKPSNPNIYQFVEFSLSPIAQAVITTSGLVNLDVTPLVKTAEEQNDDPRMKSAKWHNLTATATVEMPTRFHFRRGSSELDSRANRDIGRVASLAQEKYPGKTLLLLGFADNSGSAASNCALAQNRANAVKQELAMEGLSFDQVVGLCDEAPIAPNDNDENREKNRRVEVWVK